MRTREMAMYRERMQQVVRVLHNVKEKGHLFSLRYWGSKDPEVIAELITAGDIPEGSCGSVSCAIGHVGLDPWFNRRGFRTEMYNVYDSEPVYRERQGYEYSSWNAVHEFFNVSAEDADRLFIDGYYEEGHNTIDDVIARVNEYISTTYGVEYVVA